MIDTFAIRCKIIDLALSGNLSSQNDSEKILIEEIKNREDVEDEKKIHSIPKNWEYVHINEIAQINPKNNLDDEINVSFVPMNCVSDGFGSTHSFEIRKWENVRKGFSHFAEGDVGVAKITPCFQNRKSVVFKGLENEAGAGTTELTVVRPNFKVVESEFLLYFFQSQHFIVKGVESFTGAVGQQRIHKDYLKNAAIPLPPIEEQKRIIGIIEQSFEALDIVDELQLQYAADVEVLRSKLIDAGIQGKLTEQLPADGNAQDLYDAIQKEKKKLVDEKVIKKEKDLVKISEDEIPFEIPNNWKWVRLGDITWFQGGFAFKSNLYVKESLNQVIRLGNVKQDKLLLDNKPVFVSDELAEDAANFVIRPNYILITMTGTRRRKDYFYAKLVKSSELDNKKLLLNQRVGCIRAIKGIYPGYLVKVLQSNIIRNIILEHETGAVNQGNLGAEDIKKYTYIPLPPYEEQRRIADRIQELLDII